MLYSSPNRLIATALLTTTILMAATPAFARDQIRAVGSSTVYPFISVAAEQFGQGGKFKTPIIESTGTGGGFKLFCSGVGDNTPDINNASRPITDSEKELCKKNGVTKIVEIPIGYDGIVIANSKNSPYFDLSKKQIFLALARQLPDKNGKLATNHYKKWNEIDPKLPAEDIAVYGPPPTSGTRDAFVELAMEEGCKEVPEFAKAYPSEKEAKKACGLLREDGGYIEAGEDDNLIVQKLVSNKSALGIFGYSFLEENGNKVQGSTIDGIAPTIKNIEDDKYKLSRSLYIYVKADHLGKTAGISEFTNEIVSEGAIGDDGYITSRGLLQLHDKDKELAHERAASLKTK
ncbi:MAG: PstS family phosphate ABC transporter substrate-binding protein [Rickettsiales bacterium]|jgi:phosphate transport system substrate-binding protein